MTNEKAFKFSVRDDTNFIIEDPNVPSGSISITENGTGIDVADYATADVAVPTSATITITLPEGYDATVSGDLSLSENTITVTGNGAITISQTL